MAGVGDVVWEIPLPWITLQRMAWQLSNSLTIYVSWEATLSRVFLISFQPFCFGHCLTVLHESFFPLSWGSFGTKCCVDRYQDAATWYDTAFPLPTGLRVLHALTYFYLHLHALHCSSQMKAAGQTIRGLYILGLQLQDFSGVCSCSCEFSCMTLPPTYGSSWTLKSLHGDTNQNRLWICPLIFFEQRIIVHNFARLWLVIIATFIIFPI